MAHPTRDRAIVWHMPATMSDARAVLQRYYGYADFRELQRPAVEAVLSRRDAVIVLPTGGGKSITFQVPALLFERLTVVVSPLISLMADQVQGLEKRGIGATFLNSTLSADETDLRVARLRSHDVRLLYVAPERLAVASTTRLLREVGVDLLAIDEAHCVSEWGQDFRPSYLKLPEVRRLVGGPQVVALTATATPRVRRDIARLLELRDPKVLVGGFDRPNLTFRVRRVEDDARRNQATLSCLRAVPDPVVVYAATRRQVERVARLLSGNGVNAVPYHAGLPPERRERAQSAFMTGKARVIVATNAFGMGIDKPDVRLVLHYLHSGSLEDYYQEAGRAGRDGGPSTCIMLFNANDRGVHDRMRQASHVPASVVQSVWDCLAGWSAGTMAVPLDANLISNRMKGCNRDQVQRAIRLLQARDLLPASIAPVSIPVRLLGSALRLICERPALSEPARRLLSAIESQPGAATGGTVSLDRRGVGLSPPQLDLAIAELESRQLAWVSPFHPRVIVGGAASARRDIERTVHQLKKRGEVERAKLDAVVGYATARECRRRHILGYFGDVDSHLAPCGLCDRCAPDS